METPKTIGRYEIVDELGRGAMGAVFLARDPAMDRTVALKTILSGALASEQSEEYRQRFYREARAAGALAHPGIVPVFDVGEYDGVPFLVMEFVSGHTLADALKKGERLSMDRVCEIGQQIAEALGYAHRKGVVHRDIKPANILLTSREVYGIERPRITDFGVAKLAAGEITTTGQMLGTPAFMPPEQFTGAPIDGRTDLFSLGVILYWMATGEQPFPGETMTTVSYKIVHTEPIPPAKLNPVIPSLLDRIILKCLAKSPADRFQTGEELAQALTEVRSGANSTSMRTAIPQATFHGGDADATLDITPSLMPQQASTPVLQTTTTAATMPPVPAAPPKSGNNRNVLIVAVLGLLALAAGAGWFLTHRNGQPPVTQPTTQQGTTQQPIPAPAPTPVPPPALAQVPAAPHPPQPVKSVPAPPAPVTSKSAPPPAAATPLPHLVAVDFNPKTIDPKLNARLKIDLNHFPATLDFLIEMDGKLYYKGTAANKAGYDNLYLPPGKHDFVVTVGSGKVEKSSSSVSVSFTAKKHYTLKADLQPAPSGASGPESTIGPATKVVASLKADLFQF